MEADEARVSVQEETQVYFVFPFSQPLPKQTTVQKFGSSRQFRVFHENSLLFIK